MHLDAAVASSRGGFHAVNEDGHSTLDGSAPLFVVADGVSRGRWRREQAANSSAACTKHSSTSHRTPTPCVPPCSMPIARCAAASRAEPMPTGAATVALCAGTGTSLSRWLVAWVGDCRVYRVSRGARWIGAAAHARRHLPTLERAAAARRIARRSRPHGWQWSRRRAQCPRRRFGSRRDAAAVQRWSAQACRATRHRPPAARHGSPCDALRASRRIRARTRAAVTTRPCLSSIGLREGSGIWYVCLRSP